MAGILLLGSSQNGNRVTINAPLAYMNLAKGFSLDVDPANASSDGYPVATPSFDLLARSSPSMPGQYFGEFVWKWTGQGSMKITSSPPMIVSSSTASAGTPLT